MDALRSQLVALAGRLTHSRHDAEEIAQEALLRVHAVRSQGRTLGDERAFALSIVARLAVDRLRAEQRQTKWLKGISGPRRNGDSSTLPGRPADVQRLYHAIARLPPKQTAVVTLRKLMELEYTDIAAILDVSEENCRSLCRHAMRRLKVLLGAPSD